MNHREAIQKAIRKKEAEIEQLEWQAHDLKNVVKGLRESLKYLPGDDTDTAVTVQTELRPGSMIAKAKLILEREGRPMHVLAILKALGRPVDVKNRVSLAGSLGAYARKNLIFSKTGPNTFGLISQATAKTEESDDSAPF